MTATLSCGAVRLALDVPRVMGVRQRHARFVLRWRRLRRRCRGARARTQAARRRRRPHRHRRRIDATWRGRGRANRTSSSACCRCWTHCAWNAISAACRSRSTRASPASCARRSPPAPAMINDVDALRAPGAIEAIAAAVSPVAVCLMHMQGEPRRCSNAVDYDDVVAEVVSFLRERIAACRAAGIAADRIVVDPGFGFGKTVDHNLDLLRRLREHRGTGLSGARGLVAQVDDRRAHRSCGRRSHRRQRRRRAGRRRARRVDRASARRARNRRRAEGLARDCQ